MSDGVNVEVIKKTVRDMLSNHELEAVLIVRDRNTQDILYEVCAMNVVVEDIVSIRHTVGVFDTT